MHSALKIQPNQVLGITLVFLVLAFPISFVGEINALFDGTLKDTFTLFTSPVLKGYKDVGFVFLVLYLIAKTVIRGSVSRIKLYWLAVATTTILPVLNQPFQTYSLFGFRWVIPMLLTALMIDFVDRALIVKVGKAVIFMYILHFATQLIELVWMPPYFGNSSLNLPRVPGLFVIAGTGALFTILSLFWAMYYSKKGILRSFVLWTAPASLLFISSGTGIVVGVFLYLLFAYEVVGSIGFAAVKASFRMLLLASVVIVPVIALVFLNDLTGRDNYVEISGGSRLNIFLDEWENFSLLSTRFGEATNTAVLATMSGMVDDHGAIIVDSMVTSAMVNLGLPLAVLFLMLPLISLASSKSELIPRLSLLFIGVAFSAVTIIVEIFPANLLCAVLLAYYSTSPRIAPNRQATSLSSSQFVN